MRRALIGNSGIKMARGFLLASAVAVGAMPAGAQPSSVAVPGYGATHTAAGALERPDKALQYKVVFSITQAQSDPGKANANLEKVARFMNLLAEDGVRPKRGDVVAIFHGPATPAIMSEAAYKARFEGTPNPNLELIARLQKAGVSVRVCSQALAGNSIPPSEVDSSVQVDVAALTTMANLQLRGYALMPD